MAEPSDIKALEMRIQQLENQLKQFQSGGLADISPEELTAFVKVNAALGRLEECGVNECRPLRPFICRPFICRPAICRICRVCDVECNCGPCGGSLSGGGGGSFGTFGQ